MHTRHLAGFTLAALVLVGSLFLKPWFPPQPVQADTAATQLSFLGEPTDRTPEEYQGSVFYSSLPAMLQALGVVVYPEDKVFAFPDPALGLGSHIKIFRAQAVLIQDADQQKTVRTWQKTVGAVLDEQRVVVGDRDMVQPDQQTILLLGSKPLPITITRVSQTTLSTEISLDFSTQYQDDASLERGKEVVQEPGTAGREKDTYLITRKNGEEVSRVLSEKKVVQAPQDKIIRRGTKIITYDTSCQASWYEGVGAATAAHPSLPFGTKIHVVNVANGHSVDVTVADRGPFVAGRCIDLSSDAFAAIGSTGSGVLTVRLEKSY